MKEKEKEEGKNSIAQSDALDRPTVPPSDRAKSVRGAAAKEEKNS